MIPDSVVTLHTDIYGCGVARFNSTLAHMFGVPVVPLTSGGLGHFQTPIVSIKPSEFVDGRIRDLVLDCCSTVWLQKYGLWLHDGGDNIFEKALAWNANRVWAGHEGIRQELIKQGIEAESVKTLWSPCTVMGGNPFQHVSIFAMGMAHKYDMYWHKKLRLLLESDADPYEVNFSAAPHVGEESGVVWARSAMERVYGERAHYMGALYDEAACRFIKSSDAVAAFYQGGVKPNSSVAMAVMHWGGCLITNFASKTPSWMQHEHNCFDIGRLDAFPQVGEREHVKRNALACRRFSGWAKLVTQMRK